MKSRGGFSKKRSRGVRFDEMAILQRSPQQYLGVLEHALARAKIPAYFDRGIRRPHPAGRAFLAILNCAAENVSAKRFAEYLSLAQVPSLDPHGPDFHGDIAKSSQIWVASRDEVFGVLSERAADNDDSEADQVEAPTTEQIPSRLQPSLPARFAHPGGGKACWSNRP